MPMEIDLGPAAEPVPRRGAGVAARHNRPDDLDDGAVAADRRRPGGTSEWTRRLHEAGFLCVGWPKEYGGRGLTGVEVAVMNEEFAPGRHSACHARHGRVARRAVDHRARHRRAEGALPAPHHRRHRSLLPGLLRARRRLGPRRAEDPRRRRRRRDRDHRPEGVDLGRAPGEHDVLPLPHRPRRAEAPRHLVRARCR